MRFVKRVRKVESDGEDLLRLDAKISQAVERLQVGDRFILAHPDVLMHIDRSQLVWK